MKQYQSWGRYPQATDQEVHHLYWRPQQLPRAGTNKKLLPYGLGRSQGDSCLNDHGMLLDTTHLDRFIQFDEQSGSLTVEAGVTLAEILELAVPRGWMLPVIPGTKFVTVGGAIANDVHGKNHHRAGTFCTHLAQFELGRSNGIFRCSPTENTELFRATIGGLGLTGLITWAEIKLQPIPGAFLETKHFAFTTLTQALLIIEEHRPTHEYLVGQFDAVALRPRKLRGVVMVGNHTIKTGRSATTRYRHVPFDAPPWLLNTVSMRVFNSLYHYKNRGSDTKIVHYDPYFFPLDSIGSWNRLYGKRGFLQYQCVVPLAVAEERLGSIIDLLRTSRERSFLASLKVFGDKSSPGMLSFPRPGIVIALDFPNTGQPLLDLMEKFDQVVREAGGAVYPAKDARLSPESFKTYFPRWQEFSRHIDPAFSSSFWRRVMS